MEKLLIINARTAKDEFLSKQTRILIADGKIADTDFQGEVPESCAVFDAQGEYLLPSFIELHAHGGGGFDFGDGTKEAFDNIMKVHLSHGVTLLCPTLTTCEWNLFVSRLAFLADDARRHFMFGGIHLEGPFLSPIMCGAQNTNAIIEANADRIATLEEFADALSCITAAPECDGVELLARRMAAHGVSLSIGHSHADAPTVKKAISWGFSRVTHLYCSTSRRAKQDSFVVGGIEESALTEDELTVELIGDGHHICRESFLLTEKCKGIDRIALVSDAMRAAGCVPLPNESYLGPCLPENRVIIEDGVAKLSDRSSFAGSVASGDMMVAALMKQGAFPLSKISRMMSETPARLLGRKTKGKLQNGYDADLVFLDCNFKTTSVFSQGQKVYGGKS